MVLERVIKLMMGFGNYGFVGIGCGDCGLLPSIRRSVKIRAAIPFTCATQPYCDQQHHEHQPFWLTSKVVNSYVRNVVTCKTNQWGYVCKVYERSRRGFGVNARDLIFCKTGLNDEP